MPLEKVKSGGLAGVIAGRTSISDLDPEVDRLYYRGYDIHDLAGQAIFEETAYLLLKGELPGRRELESFSKVLVKGRRMPLDLARIMSAVKGRVHPMDFFRSSLSLLGALEGPEGDSSPEKLFLESASLIALAPLIVALAGRQLRGGKPVPPKTTLSHAANFLWMMTGNLPAPLETRAFDATLILYAEHGFNASTFAARVTASTLSDLYAAVTSAVGTLKGPLHGGANEKAMEMMLQIGKPEKAKAWVLEALGQKKKIMGFGHRVYRKKDSRHEVVKRWAGELARLKKNTKWFDMAQIIEDTMRTEKGLFPNLDFYASVLYDLLEIPIPLYTPIFAASRMSGWCAHVMEQLADNRLIRPDAEYIGPPPRAFVPLLRR